MKKNRAVVFTLSSNLVFALACVLLDIKKYNPLLADEYVIIHDGIKKKDRALLNSILPCRFILYDFPIKDKSKINQGVLSYFTKMVFAKFECLKLLGEYKSVLLLDCDIVIQDDISELFDHSESGLKMMWGGIKVRGQLHTPTADYDMDADAVIAGTFVMQDHLKNYMKMYDFCYKSLVKYGEILYMPEQAIFDFMIQEFNVENCPIDRNVYTPHPSDKNYADKAKIIHAYGQPKFWNGIENKQWNDNYKNWIKMGGSKYQDMKVKNFINKIIRTLKVRLKKLIDN